MMKPSDIDFIGLVHCSNGTFALCHACQTVVATHTRLSRHLRVEHGFQGPEASFRALYHHRPDLEAALSRCLVERVYPAPWPDDTPVVDCLPVLEAWDCLLCPEGQGQCHRRRSEETMRHHMFHEHQLRGGHAKASYKSIAIQTWYPQMHNPRGTWWRVMLPPPAPSQRMPSSEPPVSPRIAGDLLAEHGLSGTRLKADTNLFLEHAGWMKAFRGCKYHQAMRQMTYVPRPACSMRLHDPVDTASFLDDVAFSATG